MLHRFTLPSECTLVGETNVGIFSIEFEAGNPVRDLVPFPSKSTPSIFKFLFVFEGILLSREFADDLWNESPGLVIIVEIRLLILCTNRLPSPLFGEVTESSSEERAEFECDKGMCIFRSLLLTGGWIQTPVVWVLFLTLNRAFFLTALSSLNKLGE